MLLVDKIQQHSGDDAKGECFKHRYVSFLVVFVYRFTHIYKLTATVPAINSPATETTYKPVMVSTTQTNESLGIRANRKRFPLPLLQKTL